MSIVSKSSVDYNRIWLIVNMVKEVAFSGKVHAVMVIFTLVIVYERKNCKKS